MARSHFWSFIANEEGQPIPGANISLFLADTDTPAKVYDDEFNGNLITTAPQTTTSRNGFFQFWVNPALDDPLNGYPSSQKFKLVWSKTGVASGQIDFVDIFPIVRETAPVDETDSSSTEKNKTISNRLAYYWEEHKDKDVSIPTDLPVHGMEWIDITSDDTIPNKLVSNNNGKIWSDHTNSTYTDEPHGIEPVDPSDTGTDKNKLINNLLAHDWNIHKDLTFEQLPHGIEEVIENSDNTTKNKLVSNNTIKSIKDNAGNLQDAIGADSLANLDYSSNNYVDDGTSLETAIGALDYNLNNLKENLASTETTSGASMIGIDINHTWNIVPSTLTQDALNKAFDNEFTKVSYVFEQIVASIDWIVSDSLYYVDITHNLESTSPDISFWNYSTNEIEMPVKVEYLNVNSIRVYSSVANNTKIKVQK
jgi:hypothetical protein